MLTDWQLNQQNLIYFVMVDANNTEVPGLGAGFTLILSKNGAAFVASAGTKAEVSGGGYTYLATAGEADSVGIVAIIVTGAGAVQQNLEYTVQQRTPNAVAITVTIKDTSNNVIEGAEVFITSDSAGNNVLWTGDSDSLGIARDDNSVLPYLDFGTYYVWAQRADTSFTNPTTITVS